MAKNSKMSCSSNSRHISMKFFWIYDRVKQGDMAIRHYPTDIMLADFFTKALQGVQFHMFRRVVIGWDHINTLW